MKKNVYAILGSGRVARHLQHYFESLGLSARYWSRNAHPEFNTFRDEDAEERLRRTTAGATYLLFAVSDGAVEGLAGRIEKGEATRVHFSGALRVNGVHAAHPLMTFGEKLESLDWYRRVPFVTDAGYPLASLLPDLPNADFPLEREMRPLYHALCALAGNSAYLLWRAVGDQFESRLGLPRRLLTPFLRQTAVNAERPGNFTGPVARADWATVRAHLASLRDADPDLLSQYREYLHLATKEGHPVPEEFL